MQVRVGGDGSGQVSSLAAAQQRVRQLIAGGVDDDIEVRIAAGRYALQQPLRLDRRDTLPGRSVRWIGEGEVIISPGPVLHPSWEAVGDGIHRTWLSPGLDFDQLLVDGRRAQLARYPNHDPDQPLQGAAVDAISPTRTARWKEVRGGVVRGLHPSGWGGNSYTIEGRDQDQLRLAWVGDNQRGSDLHQQYRMVENIKEELDAEDEWHYEPATGLLCYYPPPGLDLSEATFQLGTLRQLINCTGGGPDHLLTGLTLENLTVTGTHRTLTGESYEPLLLGDWSVVRNAAVVLRNVGEVAVTGCRFTDVGGNALLIDGFAERVSVTDNDFCGSGASDILVLGRPSAVRSPSTWGHERRSVDDTSAGPAGEDYPRDVIISGNHLSRMGRYEKQSAGVCISMASRVTVSANTIHDGPRAAININDGTWGGHRIIGNDIYAMVCETGDHGPINAWGRDRYWPITDITDAERRQLMILDAVEPSIIAYNRIWHSSDWGIDLDDGSSRYLIEGNLLLSCGVKLREGFDREVRGNIFVAGGVHSHVSYSDCGDLVTGNLFLTATPYHFIRADPAHSLARYENNHFWNDGDPIEVVDDRWRAAGHDQQSRFGDPRIAGASPWTEPQITEIEFSDDSALPMPRPGLDGRAVGAPRVPIVSAPIDWTR